MMHLPSRLARAMGLSALAVAAAGAQQPVASAPTYVIRNVTVVPVSGPRLASASIVVQGGHIAAVGASVQAPAGATVIDGTGLFAYPGMINAGTQLGLTEIASVPGSEDTREVGDFNPQEAALTAINAHSELIPVTRVNGVTSAISAAEGGLVPGIATLINLDGWTPEDMAARARAALVVSWPSGGRGRRGGFFGQPQSPAERRAQLQRQVRSIYDLFREAKGYAEVRGRYASASELPASFRINQKFEAMRPVFSGEMPVLVDADDEEQIRGAMQFADSLGVKLVLRGASEAWRFADSLAARHIPVVVGPLTRAPDDDAPYDAVYANPGVLAKAGVLIAFQTSDAADARNLPYNAALATAYGLAPDEALRAVTVNAARIFGVEREYGTIEAGKVANLMITNGDPLDVRTQVRHVFIRGIDIPMVDRHTRLYEEFKARPKR
jgi:imidazolonepropionase-like amidohydrolase